MVSIISDFLLTLIFRFNFNLFNHLDGQCEAGRYGLKGSTSSKCTGPCYPGRYGSGGSTSVECDGKW